MTKKSERIGISMDPDLKKQIRVEAAKRDMTMAELVREVLKEEFDEGNPSRPPTAVAD